MSACGEDTAPLRPGDAAGSGAGAQVAGATAGGAENASPEDELIAAVEAHDTDVPFTLLLGNEHGTVFEASKGDSSGKTVYESASTSKWVAAAVILSLVDAGHLTLESQPQDFIEWWTSDDNDGRSRVTLRHLLSFTSGLQPEGSLSDEPCISTPLGTLDDCVRNIYEARSSIPTPGTAFVYGSHHLQVAGLMAVNARGLNDFSEVFAEFRDATGLFPSGAFDLPSATKPRLAGGMHWTGEEYLEFLRHVFMGELLSDELRDALLADHTVDGVVEIVESPVHAGLQEEWHYALGNWRECALQNWSAACDPLGRVSSPGAYGAYPFIDFANGFYGILARQGSLGSFREGLQVYRDLDPLVQEVAAAAR